MSKIRVELELLLQFQQLVVDEGRPLLLDAKPVLAWQERSKKKGPVRFAVVCRTTLEALQMSGRSLLIILSQSAQDRVRALSSRHEFTQA